MIEILPNWHPILAHFTIQGSRDYINPLFRTNPKLYRRQKVTPDYKKGKKR